MHILENVVERHKIKLSFTQLKKLKKKKDWEPKEIRKKKKKWKNESTNYLNGWTVIKKNKQEQRKSKTTTIYRKK